MNDIENEECIEEQEEEFEGTDEIEEEKPEHQIPEEFVEIARKYKAQESLTDEELDLVADTAIEILRNILSYFGADGADIDEYDGGEGELILDVNNADLALLIGRHGKTLEALQYMFSMLVSDRLGFKYPVIVDIESYKSRRRSKLESIAKNSANKALQRGQEVRLHPMKPYERRIIHLTLRHMDGVTTHSEGQEPNRFVVIVPTGKKRR